jgi:hypothetical protein
VAPAVVKINLVAKPQEVQVEKDKEETLSLVERLKTPVDQVLVRAVFNPAAVVTLSLKEAPEVQPQVGLSVQEAAGVVEEMAERFPAVGRLVRLAQEEPDNQVAVVAQYQQAERAALVDPTPVERWPWVELPKAEPEAEPEE